VKRLGLATMLILTACYGFQLDPSLKPLPPQFVYVHAPAQRVWDALVATLADRRLEIGNINRDSWFVTTQGVRMPSDASDYVDCGRESLVPGWNGFAAEAYDAMHGGGVWLKYTVRLQPAGDSTGVLVQTSSEAEDVPKVGDYQHCVSNGKLEASIVEAITTAVRTPQP